MPPKNKNKNPFFYFMKEMQERERARGHIIPMHSMAQYAHPLWVQMSVAEKEPYEEMHRAVKNDPSLRGGKLASDGTRVEDNLREIEEQEREENKMKQSIKTFVNVDCISDDQFKGFASRKMMYFISFNILCKTETDYIPIEVGIVEYSILHGIHRHYHKIIYPGRIPTGYTGEAKRLSEEKHQIDIFEGEASSERDLVSIYRDIKDFINSEDRDEYHPMFCLEKKMELTRGCLRWLRNKSRDREDLEVWNSKYLLMELRAGAGEALPSAIIAADLLTKTNFKYHPGARCEFHEEKDSSFCALAYSKCLCYLLSDAVCPVFDIRPTERHIPKRAVEDKEYVVTMAVNPSRFQRPAPVSGRLDQRSNYYENEVIDQFADAPSEAAAPRVPRQPVTSCMAAEMARLKLKMTAAPVPGHGIGRGQR